MLNLGTVVDYKGQECEVVGKKLADFGKGPVVYELVIRKFKRVYTTRMKELREINKSVIARIYDERLRTLKLKDATADEREAILNAPVVGFLNVLRQDLELID
jgi:hypothetical protein